MTTPRRSGPIAALTALALAAAGTAGCSDSHDKPADGSGLPMCSRHDHPENGVRVQDSRDHNHQFGRCGARTPCQSEELSGVVTAMKDGIPQDFDAVRGWNAVVPIRWIEIADGDHVWKIATHGLEPFPVRAGTAVTVSYYLVEAPFSPSHSALVMRVDGELAFYYGFGGGVGDIDLPPEVMLERGAASCESFDDCLSWSEYQLRASVNGSEPVTLRSGETSGPGGWLVTNFRTAQSTGRGPKTCADAFVSDITVHVARQSLLFNAPDPDMDAGSDPDACVLSFGACPAGCTPIQGRTFDAAAAQPCLGNINTLGCLPAGSMVTDDDGCAKSPDGHIVGGISGTAVARLIAESGYSNCSRPESEAWNALSLCKQP